MRLMLKQVKVLKLSVPDNNSVQLAEALAEEMPTCITNGSARAQFADSRKTQYCALCRRSHRLRARFADPLKAQYWYVLEGARGG